MTAKPNFVMGRAWPALLLCIALAACSGRSGGMLGGRAEPVVPADGVYRGEFVGRTGRDYSCATRANAVITLKLGEVRGDLFTPQDPDNPSGNFYGFIEANGQLRTTVRVGNQTMAIDASFSGDRLSGYAENEKCSMRITAQRNDAR
ncbi:MAG: hypothetical protein JNN22_06860 [Rhodospirillales bacterium]|nr:hypothetical protein [Rhodospirillales bacterium]